MKSFQNTLVILICSLVGSIVAIKIPQNPDPQPLAWWQEDIVYQVYPRSHQDTDGDGVGDIAGIEARLDHFVDIGVGAVWLSPIYRSPMVDFGYDISNFTDIEPVFGTLESFKNLSRAMKERGLKVIMDFVPNHSSDEHPWFNKSIHREGKYSDFYVWRDPSGFNETDGKPLPPNNWKSVFNGPAWTYVPERGQFYLHQFTPGQPDLNWWNREVLLEILAVFKFWLDLGVDGFRVDAVPHMFEDPQFRDEPVNPDRPPTALPDDHAYYSHIYTYDLPEVLDALAEFRQLLDIYTLADGKIRVIFVESTVPTPELFKYYGSNENPIAHFPFNFDLIYNARPNGTIVANIIDMWLDATLPTNNWPNWLVGNHDNNRVASRFSQKDVDALNAINLLLPGNAVTYYGEEIGMSNANISWEDTVDPLGCQAGPERYHLFSRDPERTPMHWDGVNKNAGFSEANKTWLPMHPNWPELNVRDQSDPDKPSHLQNYKRISHLRKTAIWKYGSVESKSIKDGSLYGFTRIFNGEGFIFLANFSDEPQTVNVAQEFDDIPATASIYTLSVGFEPDMVVGSSVNTDNLVMGARNSIILKF